MRISRSILAFFAVILFTGCGQRAAELSLVRPFAVGDAEIVLDIVDLLGQNAEVNISVTDSGLSDEAALDALLAGDADLALVSNNMPFRKGVATVMALYPTVLHVGHMGTREFESASQLLTGARIYAGAVGSASRMMFEHYIARLNISPEDFSYVEKADASNLPPDVFVVFAPISPDRLTTLLRDFPEARLISSGSPADIGTGSAIDATMLLNPRLKPFVIPVGTYGSATPTPVLTVSVDMLLVARSDLSPSVVYDLVRQLRRLRPALASQRPGLFRHLGDEFNADNSTFVLHPGLTAYMDRNEPTVYERYSGVAEVVVTLIIALFSATFAAVRIFQIRRKNRIDTFYTDVIAIRSKLDDSSTDAERAAATQQIRELQNTAFDMLVNEKLSADESFRIFISLSNDALQDLAKRDR